MGHFGDNYISIVIKELAGKTGKEGLDKEIGGKDPLFLFITKKIRIVNALQMSGD